MTKINIKKQYCTAGLWWSIFAQQSLQESVAADREMQVRGADRKQIYNVISPLHISITTM